MQLATIDMPRTEARKAFLDYRRAVRTNPLAEDEAIMRGYRELAKGTPLIRLGEALRAGGIVTLETDRFDFSVGAEVLRDVELPALAIARADKTFAWTTGIRRDGSLLLQTQRQLHHSNRRDRIDLPAGTFEPDDERHTDSRGNWRPRIRALVPTVPPRLRPPHALRNYHILWEAEWRIDHTVPPGDPALLKRVGGDLWAVVAQWDLTPLEQAVLAGRVPEV